MTDTLTIEALEETIRRFRDWPPPLVGIVCRPDVVSRMELLVRAAKPSVIDPTERLFCDTPVYTKTGQAEPYRLFFDHDALRTYLKS